MVGRKLRYAKRSCLKQALVMVVKDARKKTEVPGKTIAVVRRNETTDEVTERQLIVTRVWRPRDGYSIRCWWCTERQNRTIVLSICT